MSVDCNDFDGNAVELMAMMLMEKMLMAIMLMVMMLIAKEKCFRVLHHELYIDLPSHSICFLRLKACDRF